MGDDGQPAGAPAAAERAEDLNDIDDDASPRGSNGSFVGGGADDESGRPASGLAGGCEGDEEGAAFHAELDDIFAAAGAAGEGATPPAGATSAGDQAPQAPEPEGPPSKFQKVEDGKKVGAAPHPRRAETRRRAAAPSRAPPPFPPRPPPPAPLSRWTRRSPRGRRASSRR